MSWSGRQVTRRPADHRGKHHASHAISRDSQYSRLEQRWPTIQGELVQILRPIIYLSCSIWSDLDYRTLLIMDRVQSQQIRSGRVEIEKILQSNAPAAASRLRRRLSHPLSSTQTTVQRSNYKPEMQAVVTRDNSLQ